MKATRTKEEKQQYFNELRKRWQEAKSLSENPEFKQLYALCLEQSPGAQISPFSFAFTLQSMKFHNLEGLPYIDCKTFHGWNQHGFKVKKGAKSVIDGVTWISTEKEGEDKGNIFPKIYHLFHKSQVEAIK